MNKYLSVIFVQLAVSLATETVVPLEPLPDKFKGCYIKELDKVVKVGENATSNKECFIYLCKDNQITEIGCGRVETSSLCKVVENKSLPYPACCPKIECEEKPVLKKLKALHVLGIDLLQKDAMKPKDDKTKTTKKPPKLGTTGKPVKTAQSVKPVKTTQPVKPTKPVQPTQPTKPQKKVTPPSTGEKNKYKPKKVEDKKNKPRFFYDLRALKLLGVNVLKTRENNDTYEKENDTVLVKPEPIQGVSERAPAQTENIDNTSKVVNNQKTKINETENNAEIKPLSVRGQDLLGSTPINLWNNVQQNSETTVSVNLQNKETTINNKKE